MSVDGEDFGPIIDCHRSPNQFGGATKTSIQLKCYCLGNGTCLCFNTLEESSRDEMPLGVIMGREIEDQSNSFASDDNIHGIGNFQLPDTISDETNSSNSWETSSSTIEEDFSVNNEENISISSENIDSNTDAEGNSTATQNIPGIGRFQIEETRSDGYKCGMYALEISTNKQLAGRTLMPAVFDDIFRGPIMRAFNRQRGYRNRNDFHDEQLAYILQIWGRQERYGKLQLGVILEGGSCYILGAEDKMIFVDTAAIMETELHLGFTTIWVHNDDIMRRQGAAINHYSGITLIDTEKEQDGTRRNEAEKQEAVPECNEPQRKKRKLWHGNQSITT
ncbi:hypothetical protein KVR01_011016 [Diaporthe batatas]|uniref:uncharacterized protein n=1 Tax=Diaporthe batatas TaxID=748121 RepID=UPI001D03E18F|nr:uncharacterized protein KVR01_011016 [Diaporthe batatas]KAG8159355.1 hypothetical protein KVR01_011016 [Diaporthe batatas]